MENEKELKGQEIPETQVEPTEELNSENLASQEETTKSGISEWDASEPVLDEPVVAKAEVSEGFVSEPVIAEPVIAASEPLDSKVEEKTSEQSAYADIPQNPSLESQEGIRTKWNWGFLFSNVVWDCQPCLFGTLDFDWINPMDRLDFWDCMDDCFWF